MSSYRQWVLLGWCRIAGIEFDHLKAILVRARRAEASQLDIIHLCDVIEGVGR